MIANQPGPRKLGKNTRHRVTSSKNRGEIWPQPGGQTGTLKKKVDKEIMGAENGIPARKGGGELLASGLK